MVEPREIASITEREASLRTARIQPPIGRERELKRAVRAERRTERGDRARRRRRRESEGNDDTIPPRERSAADDDQRRGAARRGTGACACAAERPLRPSARASARARARSDAHVAVTGGRFGRAAHRCACVCHGRTRRYEKAPVALNRVAPALRLPGRSRSRILREVRELARGSPRRLGEKLDRYQSRYARPTGEIGLDVEIEIEGGSKSRDRFFFFFFVIDSMQRAIAISRFYISISVSIR